LLKEFFSKKSIVNSVVFIVAILIIGVGIGLKYNFSSETGEAIRLYNEAVSIYNEEDYVPATAVSPPSFPIDNLLDSVDYFQGAVFASESDEIKALALYNIGTAIGRDCMIFTGERSAELSFTMAITLLQEAVRLDPANEDAKYNLEYLEYYLLTSESEESSSNTSQVGEVRTSDVEDKGY
jgi:tetratricopeptide (TPR) repeat protein